jgi:hypothetical protein
MDEFVKKWGVMTPRLLLNEYFHAVEHKQAERIKELQPGVRELAADLEKALKEYTKSTY